MSSHSTRSIDDRIHVLTDELRVAESMNLATASKAALVLNQERIRGGFADALRLVEELRRRIDELENRP